MLTRTDELVKALTTDLVEHLDLLTAKFYLRDFENNLCTLYSGSANGDNTVIVNEEDLVADYLVTYLSTCDVENADLLVGLNVELLALDFNNSVHCTKNIF